MQLTNIFQHVQCRSVFDVVTYEIKHWNYVYIYNRTAQVTWLIVTEVRSESCGLVTERRHEIELLCAVSHIFAYWTSLTVTHIIFFIVECGIARLLCAMRVFDVRASSSSLRLPMCQMSFLWRPRCVTRFSSKLSQTSFNDKCRSNLWLRHIARAWSGGLLAAQRARAEVESWSFDEPTARIVVRLSYESW